MKKLIYIGFALVCIALLKDIVAGFILLSIALVGFFLIDGGNRIRQRHSKNRVTQSPPSNATYATSEEGAQYLTDLASLRLAVAINLIGIFFVQSHTRPNEIIVTFLFAGNRTASGDPLVVTDPKNFISRIPYIFGNHGWTAEANYEEASIKVRAPGLQRPKLGQHIDLVA